MDIDYTITECKRENLCVDCDDIKCNRCRDKVSDCPVYPVGRSKECLGSKSCEECKWIEDYILEIRKIRK